MDHGKQVNWNDVHRKTIFNKNSKIKWSMCVKLINVWQKIDNIVGLMMLMCQWPVFASTVVNLFH